MALISLAANRAGDDSDPLTEQMLQLLRDARERSGLSLRALSKQVRLSPAFLSLVLQGKRRPSPDAVARLAAALSLDDRARDALDQWSRLTHHRGASAVLAAARRLESEHPNLVLKIPTEDQLRLTSSVESSMGMLSDVVRCEEPLYRVAEPSAYGSRGTRWNIPVVPEGTIPDPAARHRADEFIELSPSLLIDDDALLDPFAWRLSSAGVERIADLLRPRNLVVLSRLRPPPEFQPDDIWLVELDGRLVLSRVERSGELLILPSPSAGTRILRPDPDGPADRHLRAKVVAAIWQHRQRRIP